MKRIERMRGVCKAVIKATGGFFEESKIKELHLKSSLFKEDFGKNIFCYIRN